MVRCDPTPPLEILSFTVALLFVVALEVFKIPKLELKATYKPEALKLNLFMHILNMRQKSVYI